MEATSARAGFRLFVDAPLGAGTVVALTAAQTHYVSNVMRAKAGTPVLVFNGSDGEWAAQLAGPGRRLTALTVNRQVRQQAKEPDLWLVFAPVKRARINAIVEKATELGVSVLMPVFTRQTVMTRVNGQRLAAIAAEAAEQCERLSVPEVRPAAELAALLIAWPADRALMVLDESGAGRPIAEALRELPAGPAAVLVGPEGGFHKCELDALRALSFSTLVGLGPRILRADTAVVAALACFQAIRGDWQRGVTDDSHL
jgi:16S rRNA (uracil1498-N3)-methyltransferase